MNSRDTGQTGGKRGYGALPSSMRLNELSGKGNWVNRQRSFSESHADSKEHVEAGHKTKVSFVEASVVDSTGCVNMKSNIDGKAVDFAYYRPSSKRINELSCKPHCVYRQRSLSESDADSKNDNEVGHKTKVSFVEAKDSDVGMTDYVCMELNIQKEAMYQTAERGRCLADANENDNTYVKDTRSSDSQQDISQKTKVSFVEANESEVDQTDNVNMKSKIDAKAIKFAYYRPSSKRINELSGKGHCFYRQRSLSESDANSKNDNEVGHKTNVSFVEANDSDVGMTDYVCMEPNFQKEVMHQTAERERCYADVNENDSTSVRVTRSSNSLQDIRQKTKVSFVKANESVVDQSGYVNMKSNIDAKAIDFAYYRPTSKRINVMSKKRHCYFRHQRSLSESDIDFKKDNEFGYKTKVLFVEANDSDVGLTDYVCMEPNIQKEAMHQTAERGRCYADANENDNAYVRVSRSYDSQQALKLPEKNDNIKHRTDSNLGDNEIVDQDEVALCVKKRPCLYQNLQVAKPTHQKVDRFPINTDVANKADSTDASNTVSDGPNTSQSETNRDTIKPSGKRIYIPNLHSKLIKFLIDSPDRRRNLTEDMTREGFDIVWPQTEKDIPYLVPSGSFSRISDRSSGDRIATMFSDSLRSYFILDDSICAAEEIYEDLTTLLAVAPLVTNCTVYSENMNWIIIGDKESVEDCNRQLRKLIKFLELRLKAKGITTVTKTMFLDKYAKLIIESNFFNRSLLEKLKVDFGNNFEYVKLRGKKEAVESVILKFQNFLQTVEEYVYNGSPLILRLLNNAKVKANLKELLRNRGLVSAWRVVENICIVYGASLEVVQSVKKMFDGRLVSEVTKLSDGQKELMHSEIGKEEIKNMTKRYDGCMEVEISGHLMEIACIFDIQTEVRNMLKEFLTRHKVIKTFHEVDKIHFKLLQQYHFDKLASIQQHCKTIGVQVCPLEEKSESGFLLTGQRELCMESVREIDKVLATVTSFELTIKRVEYISFLQSEKGQGQIATFESENQCVVHFPNGIPIRQNKVCVCQYDNKELIVLQDGIKSVTTGLAYIPCQKSGRDTRSQVAEVLRDKKHVTKYNFFACIPDTEIWGPEASNAVKTSVGLCLQETSKRDVSCVAFSICNPNTETYPAEYATILVEIVKDFLETEKRSTKLQKLVFCVKDELQANAFIQLLESGFGKTTIRVSASNISEIVSAVRSPRITKFTDSEIHCTTTERYDNQSEKDNLTASKASLKEDDITSDKLFEERKKPLRGKVMPHGDSDGSRIEDRLNGADVTNARKTYRLSSSELKVNVEIVHGDITSETTDAIVNSVHGHLNLSETCLGKAMLKAGGSDIQTELRTKQNCYFIRHEGIERIVVTGPGKLNCKYIFHVRLRGSVKGWKAVISSCLQLAESRKITSLAFPALGTGRNGIQPQEFAKAILKCLNDFSTTNPKSLREVRIVIYDKTMLHTIRQAANDFRKWKGSTDLAVLAVPSSPSSTDPTVCAEISSPGSTDPATIAVSSLSSTDPAVCAEIYSPGSTDPETIAVSSPQVSTDLELCTVTSIKGTIDSSVKAVTSSPVSTESVVVAVPSSASSTDPAVCAVTSSAGSTDPAIISVTSSQVSIHPALCAVTSIQGTIDTAVIGVTSSSVSKDPAVITSSPVSTDPVVVAVPSSASSTDPAVCAVTSSAGSTDPAAISVTSSQVSIDPALCAVTSIQGTRDPAMIGVTSSSVSTDPAVIAVTSSLVSTDPVVVAITSSPESKDPAMRAGTSSQVLSDPAVLAVISSKERKRQRPIHELINTEESYIEDMSAVFDTFYKPFQSSGVLTKKQLQAIFVNWQELINCNMTFLKALRDRKEKYREGQVIDIIGDILCENIPQFKPYIRFCRDQKNAGALLQRLIESNDQLREIHKKCLSKTKCMPLSSFLIKPMQRITKYPLLVKEILKCTPKNHSDHQLLLDALKHTEELCSKVNEAVREKENSDRLEWIQKHVQCDGLSEKINFKSDTTCQGPRELLHHGVLSEAKSNREFAAFLFNDFLLLTTSDGPLRIDFMTNVQYQVYKAPVVLNEMLVEKLEEVESDVFHLSHLDGVYNLRCRDHYARDTWVEKLETASRHYLDTEKKAMISINRRRTYRLSSSEGMVNVEVIHGDIVKETTDAIVNSVHSHLDLSTTFIGSALLKAGGSDIQKELEKKENCSSIRHEGIEGIVVTGPGKLNCKNIFHVMLQGNVKGWETVISSCLQFAETSGLTSLSFPALGTGRNGIKPQEFAKAILKCISNFSTTNPKSLREVHIVIYDEAMFLPVLQTAKANIYDVKRSSRQLDDEVLLQVYTSVDNVDNVKRNLNDLFIKETTER